MERFELANECSGLAKDKSLNERFFHLKAMSTTGFPIVLMHEKTGKVLKMENFLLSSKYKEEMVSAGPFLLLKQATLKVIYFKQLDSFVLVPLTTSTYGFPCKVLANEYKKNEMFACPDFNELPGSKLSFNFVDCKMGIYYSVECFLINFDPKAFDFSVPGGKFPVLLGSDEKTIGLWQYCQYMALPPKQRKSNTKIDEKFSFVASQCQKLTLC